MPRLIFTLKRQILNPVHLELLSPDNLADKKITKIANDAVWEGNRLVKLKSLFNIEEDPCSSPEEVVLEIAGDLSKTRLIGHGMTKGTVQIEGAGGLYIGESMKGGRIVVEGKTGSWLGSNMKGGTIEVSGNVGDFVGAASRGTAKGMTGGSITVRGDAGNEIGAWMHSGTIKISGNSGMFPGVHMRGGTIHVAGECPGRAGAQMVGGKVVISGKMPSVLPSFSFEDIREQTKVEKDSVHGPFYIFSGDNNEDGSGRLFINVESNPQLKWCENLLDV